MINPTSMNVQTISMQQSNCKKNSKNLNFKAYFVKNRKFLELCEYANEDIARKANFKKAINKLHTIDKSRKLPQEKLILDFGQHQSLKGCDYGGRLKQGLVPFITKKFVSITTENNSMFPAPIEFVDDELSAIEKAYELVLSLVDTTSPLYKALFYEPATITQTFPETPEIPCGAGDKDNTPRPRRKPLHRFGYILTTEW